MNPINDKEDIRQIIFDQIKDIVKPDYMSDDIAFHTDIKELPIKDGSLRADMLIIIACSSGKLQIERNTVTHALRQNQALICFPNDIASNMMLSPDFQGVVLCISQRGISELYSESDLWDKAFHIAENPIINICVQSLQMLNMYGEILREKIKMGHFPYHNKIIISILKATLYELLANVTNDKPFPYSSGYIKQREVLFKRFIDLLANTTIKPRCVQWYADQLCITPKYLSTISKQVSGKTAFNWINEYISVDIRYWLKNSDKTIKEITAYLNFPNISFFGKYCRTHFGMSPSALRKKFREQPVGKQALHP